MEKPHGWDELALVPEKIGELREICRHGAAGGKLHVLLSGSSGAVDKVVTAIARELGLELYRVDLLQVVSKYIGETEKNLAHVFAAADRAGSVLLFDEADALFGKRSEVKDSHDRYANIEARYLLMRLEEYPGPAFLATSRRADIDEAFLRRFRFIVSLDAPEVPERAVVNDALVTRGSRRP